MTKLKEKETMGSFKRFLLNKGKYEEKISIILNGNKKGVSNELLSELTKLTIQEVEEILKNAPKQEIEE